MKKKTDNKHNITLQQHQNLCKIRDFNFEFVPFETKKPIHWNSEHSACVRVSECVCVSWLNLFSLIYWLLLYLNSNRIVHSQCSSYSRYRYRILPFISQVIHPYMCVCISIQNLRWRRWNRNCLWCVKTTLHHRLYYFLLCFFFAERTVNEQETSENTLLS